jgi:glucose-1-phosphate thymidylyltransferase
MATDKVLVLARGLGSRMQKDSGVALSGQAAEMAAAGLKGLIPVAGRPFLDFLFGAIVEAGFREACLVVGPDSSALRKYGEDLAVRSGLNVYFAVQQEPKGTADAVKAGEGFAEGDPIVMVNCDNWMSPEGLRVLREARGMDGSSSGKYKVAPRPADPMAMRDPGYDAEYGGGGGGDEEGDSEDTAFGIGAVGVQSGFLLGFERDALLTGNIPADRVGRFAVLEVAPDGKLARIVEKPQRPDDYVRNGKLWVSMNCWQFPPSIFDACKAIGPSPRGEFEITDAVQWLIDGGHAEFRVLYRSEAVYDLTGRGDIASVEKALSGYRIPFGPPKA